MAVDQTRAKILASARTLLTSTGPQRFTVDAVARQAGVARMTVYYQFGSKPGLLGALLDDLATATLVDRLRSSPGESPSFEALAGLIGAFVGFWASNRLMIRRLRSLAGLDADVDSAIRARDARRHEAVADLVGQLLKQRGAAANRSTQDAVDVLQTITSFETFDALAGASRSPQAVTTLLIRLAHAWVGLE